MSLIGLINDHALNCWFNEYILDIRSRCGIDNRKPSYDSVRLFKYFTVLPDYVNALIAFLFYVDILLNKGVYLVHENGILLGRSSKSSLLHREFTRCSECQYIMTQGLKNTMFPNMFSPDDNVTPIRCKGDRSLTIKEYRNLNENLQHHRMLFYYNRQRVLFNYGLCHKDDNDDFTHKDGGLKDKKGFCPLHPIPTMKDFIKETIDL